MRTEIRKQTDPAAALFGAASERGAFERSARGRADAPQTAPLTVLTLIATTLYYGC